MLNKIISMHAFACIKLSCTDHHLKKESFSAWIRLQPALGWTKYPKIPQLLSIQTVKDTKSKKKTVSGQRYLD